MQLEIYQWLVPLVSLFFLSRTFIQYRNKRRSLRSALVWLVFWLTLATMAIIPNQISNEVAELLGFKSNVNAIIFVALGLLFLFVFYLSASLERMERKMTELVRKLALREKDQEIKEE
jgi:hypothetical protein